MKKLFFTVLAFLCFSGVTFSQVNIKDSIINTSLTALSYSYQFPAGDISKRFVSNSTIGGAYLYKTKKNWLIGADGFFMFRDTIKETGILDSINNSDGGIIDGNGIYADVRLYERGFYTGIKGGKLFPVWGPNKNSGIIVLIGAGLLQHKIRIENSGNSAPQISGDYRKGYDRLTNGFALSEFVGYMYLGNSRLVSFYAGFELVQAWTKNRRSYNFDLKGPDNTKRFDLLNGFRIGWIIPLYKQTPQKYYYN
jgi:hypothetical protein